MQVINYFPSLGQGKPAFPRKQQKFVPSGLQPKQTDEQAAHLPHATVPPTAAGVWHGWQPARLPLPPDLRFHEVSLQYFMTRLFPKPPTGPCNINPPSTHYDSACDQPLQARRNLSEPGGCTKPAGTRAALVTRAVCSCEQLRNRRPRVNASKSRIVSCSPPPSIALPERLPAEHHAPFDPPSH